MGNLCFPLLLTRIFVLALLGTGALTKVECLNFSYQSFKETDATNFFSPNSLVALNAIQVTVDLSDPSRMLNQSGRFVYKEPFNLWRDGDKKAMASFNSTFVLNISPYPTKPIPIGEGLAFILTAKHDLPDQSQGEWLGIVNENTNGSSQAGIVAVEFDTKKSFAQDVDDNHIGLNLNSVYSIKQESLTDHGLDLSSGSNFSVRIQYDGQNLSVFVWLTNEEVKTMTSTPVLTLPLNLSDYLPEKVYVGFSASTGVNNLERNCILKWDFHSSDKDDNPNLLWVWIAIPVAVVLLVGFAFCLYRTRLSRKEDLEEAYPRIEERIRGSSISPKRFQLKELVRATSNFNPKNKLGRGGFGTVYKGLIGDQEVAVKRVSKDSRQGEQEFIAEVTTIGSLSHRNLVKLIGWCYESNELLLVYEFMPNGSLDKFIFGDENLNSETPPELSWERRRRIIRGVAQALDYLHNGCDKRVLHRDIKSSNIMLDSEFNAKLGDFGLARMIQLSENTHHSTREIAGTPGYMSPESFLTGRATVETDVYAFGVLVLEVVSGRKPGNQNEQNSFNNSMVTWIWRLYNEDRLLDSVDRRLDGQYEDDEMGRVLVLGLACCHPNPHERPSMRAILKVLIGEEDPPILPAEIPLFVWPSMPRSIKSDSETTLQGGQLISFTEVTGR